MLTHHAIKIGDRARFPFGRLGDEKVYRHSFEAIAFRNGLVVARRLADGYTREVAIRWWKEYTLDYRRHTPDQLLPVRRLPLPRLNADRGRPGFYVSILHAGKPGAYILAAGPFDYVGDADRVVRHVRSHVSKHFSDREYFDLRFGCCKVETGSQDGKFNQELGIS